MPSAQRLCHPSRPRGFCSDYRENSTMSDIRTTQPILTGHPCVWIKSSYSNAGQNCVEVAGLGSHATRVGVRDSKQNNGPALAVPAAAWTSFIREVQAGGRLG
ncbi:DUF397 domain-containing protein [Streptomyces sp. C36]|uniref:DUF397 domain-containing protein n=1 Tax=Streptomyces sp. C36 TaxID=3237122 RepID=UPI0034C6CBD7